jgi:hypothetical protein
VAAAAAALDSGSCCFIVCCNFQVVGSYLHSFELFNFFSKEYPVNKMYQMLPDSLTKAYIAKATELDDLNIPW